MNLKSLTLTTKDLNTHGEKILQTEGKKGIKKALARCFRKGTLAKILDSHKVTFKDEVGKSITLKSHPKAPGWNPDKPACPKGEEYDGCKTVGDRAQAAENLLLEHSEAKTEGKIFDYHVADILTDLFHLADREGWNIEQLIQSARNHHENER